MAMYPAAMKSTSMAAAAAALPQPPHLSVFGGDADSNSFGSSSSVVFGGTTTLPVRYVDL